MLEALLALHLGNHHCRQIILGVSHENGYAFQLEDVSNNPCSTAIYLLEGYPVEKDLSELKSKFKTLKFDRIFRSTKLSVHDPSRQTLITRLHTTSHGPEPIASRGADASLTTSTLPSYIATQKSAASSPSPKPAFLPISDSTKPLTWAKLASAAPPPKTLRGIAPLPSLSSARRSIKESLMASELDLIPRNIHGQRIDKFYSTTQTEWRRIQSLHLCNVHFLRQECTYGDKCTHIHSLTVQQGGLPDGSLTKRDLEILTQVSRYAPCRDGTACDDVNCTFGHRCPVLERLSHHGKRDSDRDCKHGKNCKFPDTMHVFDTRVVGLVEV